MPKPRSSLTAEFVCAVRAAESMRPPPHRRLDDPYARWFLTAPQRTLLSWIGAPSAPLVAAFSRGIYDDVIERHVAIDRGVTTSLNQGADRLIVLGAGYDSRAWRLARPGLRVLELDLAQTLNRKEACIRRHRSEFPATVDVTRAPVDFRRSDWADRLPPDGHGTVVVWEGVSMYLDRAEVEATLGSLRSGIRAGTKVLFDVWSGAGDDVLTRWGRRGLSLVGEPLRFLLAPSEAPALVEPLGFELVGATPLNTSADRLDGGRYGHLTLIELRVR